MTLPQGEIDLIATQIVVDARAALASLKIMSNTVEDTTARLDVLKRVVTATANQMGGDLDKASKQVTKFANALTGIKPAEIKQVTMELKQIDAATKKAFGDLKVAPAEVNSRIQLLSNGIRAMAAESKQSIEQVTQALLRLNSAQKPGQFGKLGFSAGDIQKAGVVAQQTADSISQVGANSQKAGQQAESAFGKVFNSVNAVRIALGAIISMILFQVIQAFSSMAQGALKGLTEIEAAMFNIVNAEKRLSEQGFDIKVEGLEKLIEDLQKLDPMLSKFQATELVSSLATKVAPAIGLTEKEIASLAKSITVLAVQNQALGKSFEEVEQQVITGLLSGRVTSGINQLGTKITEQRVQEEALALRLVQSAEAYKELNAREKERIDTLAIISILEQDTAQQAANLPAFLKTASGLIGQAKAEFQDFLTTLGQKFAPLLKEIFGGVIKILERINKEIQDNDEAFNALVTLFTVGARAVIELTLVFIEFNFWLGEVGNKLFKIIGALPLLGSLSKKLFPENGFADTPTAPGGFSGSGTPDVAADAEKQKAALSKFEEDIANIMQDARDKRLDIERDYQRKLQDIARDYANKLIDIARETAEKREDALRNYNERVEDINRDASNRIEEAQEEARQREIDREREYQNRLRELREKFLFDLEDALHARDARQVLRLIRQYNLDKKNLEERRKLEQNESKENLRRKLEDIERDRKLKLEAARREYEDRLNEIAIGEQRALDEAGLWRRRQLEDARLWHQRQLEEQRNYLQRKLRDLAAALAQELQLTSAQAQAMANILSSVGTGASSVLSGFTQTGGAVSGSGAFASFADTFNTLTGGHGYGLAEGGTVIARKPTLALFGEKGAEAANFTPLNRVGKNVGKVFGDTAGINGANGSLALKLTLSDGLVAEIVETSLENVATHFEQIRREM